MQLGLHPSLDRTAMQVAEAEVLESSSREWSIWGHTCTLGRYPDIGIHRAPVPRKCACHALAAVAKAYVFYNGGNGPCDMESLVNKGKWPLLTKMHVGGQQFGLRLMDPILEADWRHLEDLDLSYSKLCDYAISLLAASHWPKLETLHLESNKQTLVP